MTPEHLVAAAAADLTHLAADPVRWRDRAVLLAVARAWDAGDAAAVRAVAQGYDRLLRRLPDLDGTDVVLRPAPVAVRRGLGAWSTGTQGAAELARLAIPARASGAVCDPACGAGALLRAAFARLVGLGDDAHQAAQRLHGVDVDPVAVQVARTVLAVDVEEAGGRLSPADLASRLVVGDALTGPVPAHPAAGPDGERLVWHEAFPQVLDRRGAQPEPVTGWRGGFDAVLANPPWERIKLLRGEHGDADPAQLRARRSGVRQAARELRTSGRHPLTGRGELNAYLLFAETCWRLLSPTGRAALLAPVGLAADVSSGRLLRALLAAGCLERLHVRRNGGGDRPRLVPDLADRHQVVVAVLRGRQGPGRASVQVGDGRSWPLDRALLDTVNPNSGTAPLCAGPRDARLLGEVHERVGVLLRRDGEGTPVADPWRVRLRTPLHITRDARHFRPAPGPGLVPVWEAKLAGLLDHRCATWDGRRARPAAPAERADPGWEPSTRWWVPEQVAQERLGEVLDRGWLGVFRNTTMVSAERTVLPAALPPVGVANSLPVVQADRLPVLLAALSSLPLDWAARQKLGGANLSLYKVEQLPVPPPSAYDARAPWEPDRTVGQWVLTRLADAVRWSVSLRPLAVELGMDDVPRRTGDAAAGRRRQALAELDAVHAWLLGMSREDLRHVLSTFGALRAREEREHGRYVTADRVLGAFDVLGLDVAA